APNDTAKTCSRTSPRVRLARTAALTTPARRASCARPGASAVIAGARYANAAAGAIDHARDGSWHREHEARGGTPSRPRLVLLGRRCDHQIERRSRTGSRCRAVRERAAECDDDVVVVDVPRPIRMPLARRVVGVTRHRLLLLVSLELVAPVGERGALVEVAARQVEQPRRLRVEQLH